MKLEDINTSTPVYIHQEDLIHHTQLPNTQLSLKLDRLINAIGSAFSWVWVVLVLIVITNVVMRYVFHNGLIEFEEIQWHLYSIGWLFGLSYCFVADEHVRVDLIHDRLSLVAQAWVELIGMVTLLVPFIAIVLIYAVPFVAYSWEVSEISDAPGGLPYRWAIKAALLVGFALLMLALVSRMSRVISLLYNRYTKDSAKAKETTQKTAISETEVCHGN